MKTISIDSIAQLTSVAEQLLTFANGNKFFVFEGEMAAGKTTFIKSFCEILCVLDIVSSPTFSLVNEYEMSNSIIYHFDSYRLKTIHEALVLTITEQSSAKDQLIQWYK